MLVIKNALFNYLIFPAEYNITKYLNKIKNFKFIESIIFNFEAYNFISPMIWSLVPFYVSCIFCGCRLRDSNIVLSKICATLQNIIRRLEHG